MSKKKKMKKLLESLKLISLPESTIDCLLSDIRETRRILIKTFNTKDNPYNTKTKYGLLYTTFNNLKVKFKMEDYSMRNDFIAWFINDQSFDAMFNEWRDLNFDKQYKPSFIVKELPLTKENINLLPYNLSIVESHKTHSVPILELNVSGAVVCMHQSISSASRASGVPLNTIRAHLKTNNTEKFMIYCHTNDER